MKKRLILILTSIVIIVLILFLPIFFSYDFPIVLNWNKKDIVNIQDTNQIYFNPLEGIDFSIGNNLVYLIFERTDIKNLPYKMKKNKLFECRDNKIIQEIQQNFIFKKSNGDMATCDSKIIFYNNNKLVFCSSFVFTDNILGIQNSKSGWADVKEKEKLKKNLIKFKPVYKAIVRL